METEMVREVSFAKITGYFLLTVLMSFLLSVVLLVGYFGITGGPLDGQGLVLLIAGSLYYNKTYALCFVLIFLNSWVTIRQNKVLRSLTFLLLPSLYLSLTISKKSYPTNSSDFIAYILIAIAFIVTACFMHIQFSKEIK